MAKIEINTRAPDFALDNFNGEEVRLSSYHGRQPVLLVLNRGFV